MKVSVISPNQTLHRVRSKTNYRECHRHAQQSKPRKTNVLQRHTRLKLFTTAANGCKTTVINEQDLLRVRPTRKEAKTPRRTEPCRFRLECSAMRSMTWQEMRSLLSLSRARAKCIIDKTGWQPSPSKMRVIRAEERAVSLRAVHGQLSTFNPDARPRSRPSYRVER